MAISNLWEIVKADRYTADGREAIAESVVLFPLYITLLLESKTVHFISVFGLYTSSEPAGIFSKAKVVREEACVFSGASCLL